MLSCERKPSVHHQSVITENFSLPPSMAHQLSSVFLLLLLFVLNLLCSSTKQQVSAELVMEEGYTVSTLFDGNKLSDRINPSSVLPRFSGTHDLLILDTPSSSFYTLKFPISQDSEINKLSGNGIAGFSDGDLSSAMFDRPRNFAVDLKGNVYVADKNNHVIRKIGNSGVTTIAGAYAGKPGRVDGAAQNASFSEDFELVFVPQLCALLISDRGNRLIRQMSLKPEDCASGSKQQLGLVWVSLLGVFCSLVGLVVGFAAHPFLISRQVVDNHLFNVTWKHCQINLGKKVLIVFSDIKSAIASSTAYSLMGKLVRLSISHLSLMFNLLRVERQSVYRDPPPFYDSYDACRHESTKSEVLVDQLKDLITFDEELDSSDIMNEAFTQGDQDGGSQVLTCSNNRRIDSMIQSNIMNFDEEVRQRDPLEGSLMGSSGLVNRKKAKLKSLPMLLISSSTT